MGFFKKVFRPVRKVAKKIIPKEIRPFLPYMQQALDPDSRLSIWYGLGSALAQRALIAAATSAATDEQGNPLRAGVLAAAPGAISRRFRTIKHRKILWNATAGSLVNFQNFVTNGKSGL